MPRPTKPFGKPGGMPGAMMGAGNKMPAMMNSTASDGLSALQARLGGAKKNKRMKPPKRMPKGK